MTDLRAGEEGGHKLFKDLGVFGLATGAVHGAHAVGARAGDLVLVHKLIQLSERLLSIGTAPTA